MLAWLLLRSSGESFICRAYIDRSRSRDLLSYIISYFINLHVHAILSYNVDTSLTSSLYTSFMHIFLFDMPTSRSVYFALANYKYHLMVYHTTILLRILEFTVPSGGFDHCIACVRLTTNCGPATIVNTRFIHLLITSNKQYILREPQLAPPSTSRGNTVSSLCSTCTAIYLTRATPSLPSAPLAPPSPSRGQHRLFPLLHLHRHPPQAGNPVSSLCSTCRHFKDS